MSEERPVGKKPSGWENELRRREKKAEEAKQAEMSSGERVALLERIGPLPLDDPETSLVYLRRAGLVWLGELMKDPAVTPRECFAAVKQMMEASGKTHSSTSLESRLQTVEAEINEARARVSAVKVTSTDGVPIPPTARGGSRARRPRAVETPPTGPDEP